MVYACEPKVTAEDKQMVSQGDKTAMELKGSFKCAGRGLRMVFKEERSFKIDIGFATLAVAMAIYFRMALLEVAILVGIIALVLSLEVLNTVIERLSSQLGRDPLVGKIKDISAGGVLIAAICSVAIGVLLFLPYVSG